MSTTRIPAVRLAIVSMRKAAVEDRLYVTDDRKNGRDEFWDFYAIPPTALRGRLEKLVMAVPDLDSRFKYFATYNHLTDR